MSIIGYNNSLSIKNLEIWQILVKLGILSMQALGSKGTDENRKKSEEFKDLKMELEAFKEKQFEGRKAFLASDKDTSGDDKSTTSPVEFQIGYAPDQEIQFSSSNFDTSIDNYYLLRSTVLVNKIMTLSTQLLESKETDEDRQKFEELKDLKMELEALNEIQFKDIKIINSFPASDKDTSGDDKSTTSPVEFQTGYVPDQEIQ